MASLSSLITPAESQYQQQALNEVSRTFALTIPLLPTELEHAVGNAYLLCRIADTIEDDTQLSSVSKGVFSQRLIKLVNGAKGSHDFATQLARQLSPQTPSTELDLIAHTTQVLNVTRKLSAAQISAIKTCIRRMATGMSEFQLCQNGDGLPDMATLNNYCYVVAGVVGEMLTDFFCAHSVQIADRRKQLSKLAFSFGQGLQLTNILKDIRVDKARGICWLPRAAFSTNSPDFDNSGQNTFSLLSSGLNELIGIAQYHLNNALQYALNIPRSEIEIRRFLIFPIVLALLTLRKLHASQGDLQNQSLKISRRSVMLSGLFIKFGSNHDKVVNALVSALSKKLPTIVVSSR